MPARKTGTERVLLGIRDRQVSGGGLAVGHDSNLGAKPPSAQLNFGAEIAPIAPKGHAAFSSLSDRW